MSSALSTSHVDRVASTIREDIRARGLRPGHRYLTTAEVAENLGVAKATANRAMQALASAGLLVRRPKAGTFVGDAAEPRRAPGFDVVHLVISKDYFEAERSDIQRRMSGVIDSLDDSSFQYTFVPRNTPEMFLAGLIENARNSGLSHGFLVGLKGNHLQSFFLDSGLPCVLLGSVFPGIGSMASIDLDQARIGRLTVEYACKQGARRIAILMRSSRGYGDDLLCDAAIHEAVRQGLEPGGLLIRSVPPEEAVAGAVVKEVIGSSERPDAVICRSRTATRHLMDSAQALGLRVPDDLIVVSADPVDKGSEYTGLPHIRPLRDDVEEGRLFAELLLRQVDPSGNEPKVHVIPVRLESGAGR